MTDHISNGILNNLKKTFPEIKNINFGMVLLIAYILFVFAALQGILGFVNNAKLPLVLAIISLCYASYLLISGRVDFAENTTKIFIFLVLFLVCDGLFRSSNPKNLEATVKIFLQVLSNYLIMIACVKKPAQFVMLIDVWLASIIFSCFHAIMQGGKIWGNMWLKDENHISLIAAYAIPFAVVLLFSTQSRFKKICYIIALFFYITVVCVAASRGGALAMIGVGFCWWLTEKNKIRNLLVAVLATVLIFCFAPPKFFAEMDTLKQGTEEGTAGERIYLWGIAWKMFKDHPIFGVGQYNYVDYVIQYDVEKRYYHRYFDKGMKKVAHSTPVQWLAESGIVGAAILIYLQMCMYKNWRIIDNELAQNPRRSIPEDELAVYRNINHACAISQVGFWIAASFLTLIPYPFYWILIPFSETWKDLFLDRINQKVMPS